MGKKAESPWITHLKAWVTQKQKTNPKYTYRDALSDKAAGAAYKKHGKKMKGGDVFDSISGVANTASNAVSGVTNTAANAVSGVTNTAANAVSGVANTAAGAIKGVANAAKNITKKRKGGKKSRKGRKRSRSSRK